MWGQNIGKQYPCSPPRRQCFRQSSNKQWNSRRSRHDSKRKSNDNHEDHRMVGARASHRRHAAHIAGHTTWNARRASYTQRMYGDCQGIVGAYRPTARNPRYHSQHSHGYGQEQQDSHKQVSFASVRFREWSPKATNCITAYHRRALIYSSANLIISQHACACQGYSKFFRFIIGAKNFGASPLSRLADCDVRRLSRRKHKNVLAAQERLRHSKRYVR